MPPCDCMNDISSWSCYILNGLYHSGCSILLPSLTVLPKKNKAMNSKQCWSCRWNCLIYAFFNDPSASVLMECPSGSRPCRTSADEWDKLIKEVITSEELQEGFWKSWWWLFWINLCCSGLPAPVAVTCIRKWKYKGVCPGHDWRCYNFILKWPSFNFSLFCYLSSH